MDLDFAVYTVVYMQYVLPPGYISSSCIIPLSQKLQGIRNDDQSLSLVTPLAFLTFLIS